MKKFLTICSFLVFTTTAFTQNAIVGSGFTSGWSTTGNFEYFASSAGSSYIKTDVANGTGNQYFRLGIDWSGTTAQNTITVGTDVQVSEETEYTLNGNNTSSGAMYLNVTSTSHNYVFKTADAGTNPSRKLIIFRVEGTVQTVINVGSSPASPTSTDVVTVTATISGSFSTGQAAYLRYTTDNFATSTVVAMTGSGTSYSGTIPAQAQGTTVKYYVFTSGDGLTISGANADWYTINSNTNGGSNYSYTTVLPISLTAFTATPRGSAVVLNWETATELNNELFSIERSTDGRAFEVIATQAGAGTSLAPIAYSYTDHTPANGINYYRLTQTDYDGTSSQSDVVAVRVAGTASGLQLAPNPATNRTRLTYTAAERTMAQVRVVAADGRTMSTTRVALVAGENSVGLDVAALRAGNYVVQLTDEQGNLLGQARLAKQ